MAQQRRNMVGRGGAGNIVDEDQIAPPPAPMETTLEVETAKNRHTAHGRGGEGNKFWHVLEKGVFRRVIRYEQKVVLQKRAMEDDVVKSPKRKSFNGSERVGSPMSDGHSLCRTQNACEDGSVANRGFKRLSLPALPSLTKLWNRRSTSSSLEHGTRPRSTTVTTVSSADFPITPVTPIDRTGWRVSVASADAVSPLSERPDIPSSAQC